MHTYPAHTQAGQALPADPSRLPIAPAHTATAASRREPRRWTSRALLDGEREVLIDHEGSTYRLRLTSLGKLILTK